MLFTDTPFLFYFLPLALFALRMCYSNQRFTTAARVAIIVLTLVFYGYGKLLWPLHFVCVIDGVYLFTLLVLVARKSTVRRKGVFVGTVVYAPAALALFKYLNWLVTLWLALEPLRTAPLPYFGELGNVLLTPGISFFVFEALSFAIDAYRSHIVQWIWRCSPDPSLDRSFDTTI
jgi:alginate O-acetyltransferase complex protein AlgI